MNPTESKEKLEFDGSIPVSAVESKNIDSEPRDSSDSLERYIKLVEEEKQEWQTYGNSLKKQYYDLKSHSKARKKVEIENFNYVEYLPEEEKEFLLELQRAKEQYLKVQEGVNCLNTSIYLINSEIENQENLFLQELNFQKMKLENNDKSILNQ